MTTVSKAYQHTKAGILPMEWDARPLCSIANEITETAGTSEIETVSISAGIGFVNQAEKFGKDLSGKQYEKYAVLHRGDFSYNKGNSKTYQQGCIYRLKDREQAAVPNVFESFRIIEGCPDYFEQLFISGFLNHQLYKKINHGVRDDGLLNLTAKDFYSCVIPFPPLNEQRKIAEILSQCDKVIALYQAELDEIKLLKKACLQMIFPKEGEVYPEYRFSCFAGAWKQHKLGECADLLAGYPFESKLFSIDGIKLVRGMNVKRGYLDFSEPLCEHWGSSTGLEEYLLKAGDILVQMDGALIGQSYARISEIQLPALLVQRVTRIRAHPEIADNAFIYHALQTNFRVYIRRKKTETAVPHLSLNDIATFQITIPSVSEQKNVGTFFDLIDHCITLHQRKLDAMQQKKKALAQLLLTGIVRVKND